MIQWTTGPLTPASVHISYMPMFATVEAARGPLQQPSPGGQLREQPHPAPSDQH
jgi:hypothetical protein